MGGMMRRLRILLAGLLIRMARKVCIYGFTDDYLAMALRHEHEGSGENGQLRD